MERFKIQSLNRQELPENDEAHVDSLRNSVKMASQGKQNGVIGKTINRLIARNGR